MSQIKYQTCSRVSLNESSPWYFAVMKSPLLGCTESVAWGFLAAPFRADEDAAGLSREYSLQNVK